MIYTLFFSRLADLDAETLAEYEARAAQLLDFATRDFPGFVDLRKYTSDDGERLTVVRFEEADAQRAWREDDVHRVAQRLGRSTYYDRYEIVVCDAGRAHGWDRSDGGAA